MKRVLEYSAAPDDGPRHAFRGVLIGTMLNAALWAALLLQRPVHDSQTVAGVLVPAAMMDSTIVIAVVQIMMVVREVRRFSLNGSTVAAVVLMALNLVVIAVIALLPSTQ